MSHETDKIDETICHYITSSPESATRLVVPDIPISSTTYHYPYVCYKYYDEKLTNKENENAKWYFKDTGDGYYYIESAANGMQHRLLNNAVLPRSWQWSYICDEAHDKTLYQSDYAKWKLEPVSRPEGITYRFVNKGSNASLLSGNTQKKWHWLHVSRLGYDDRAYSSRYAEWKIEPAELKAPENPFTKKANEPKGSGLFAYIALASAVMSYLIKASGIQSEYQILSSTPEVMPAAFLGSAAMFFSGLCFLHNFSEAKSYAAYSTYNANLLFISSREASDSMTMLAGKSMAVLGNVGFGMIAGQAVGKVVEVGLNAIPNLFDF